MIVAKKITEKEIKIAAKNLRLQYGLATLLIAEIRKIQKQQYHALHHVLRGKKCPKCGGFMLVDRIKEEGKILCDFIGCDFEMTT